MRYLMSIWHMAVEAAPWLLLGFLAAAAVRAWVPTAFISRQLGGRRVGSVVKASVIGIPLPLCSCGVLPAALGLRRQGASRPATVSFLVSTPEIGFDSFMLSYVLLGPFMAMTRPIAALFTSITAGLAALAVGEPNLDRQPEQRPSAERNAGDTAACCREPAEHRVEVASCCDGGAAVAARPAPAAVATAVAASCGGGTTAVAEAPARPACGDGDDEAQDGEPASSCCDSAKPQAADSSCCEGEPPRAANPGPIARLVDGVRYVFTTLLDDIKWWLLAALVIAGVAMAVTEGQPATVLQEWGRGPLAMIVMLVVGIPLYVCATASTPIAAALLVAGVSPGAVMVLLLAGPATNIGSIAILRKELGTKTLLGYLGAIAVCSVAVGMTVNGLVERFQIDIVTQAEHAGHVFPHGFAVAATVILVALAIPPVRRVMLWMPKRQAEGCP